MKDIKSKLAKKKQTSSEQYVIWTAGSYVHSYNAQHMVITTTTLKDKAKRFPSFEAATKWVNKYRDAGFGLETESSCIEPL